MKWITREHINVDRVACPWLIRRFIDPSRARNQLQSRESACGRSRRASRPWAFPMKNG